MVFLVSRSHVFSPNSVQRDEAIYKAVLRELKEQGEEVCCISENDLIADPSMLLEADSYGAPKVISMGRDVRTLRILERSEAMGFTVYNAPSALLAGNRIHIDAVMDEVGLGMKTLGTTTDVANIEKEIGYPLWIKTAKTSTQHIDDVRFIDTRENLLKALSNFGSKPGNEWILCEHIVGDLIKFYGVEGTGFFFWMYPTQKSDFSKYGKEKHNGKPHGYRFSEEILKESLDEAAEALGMYIYGGDAVVRPDGSIVVVDFNDFPSFASCCRTAAEAIVARVLNA